MRQKYRSPPYHVMFQNERSFAENGQTQLNIQKSRNLMQFSSDFNVQDVNYP
jgi:hypothetical protein